jgi:phosphoglucosamine mutase
MAEGPQLAASADLGRARRIEDGRGRYIEAAKASFPRHLSLAGLRIVVDCANGAAYRTAPTVLWELGAEVIPIGISPDGVNINAGVGSTAPEACRRKVIETRADLGVALDGDADRVLIIDERGRIVDGDQIMALIAQTWAAAGRLRGGALVTTVMSNLGLERKLDGLGIALRRTAVGDRYVVADMRDSGCNLGGEQSGHIVMSDHATTGDGLLAALQVLAAIVAEGRPASQVCARFVPLPQVLTNLRLAPGAPDPMTQPAVRDAIAAGEAALAGTGRVLIRKSGTEPLIRVMAEGEDEALVDAVVAAICTAIRAG